MNDMNSQKPQIKVGSVHHILAAFFSLIMAGSSLYLTYHYFNSLYPSDGGLSSLCHISDFFNCDTAMNSSLSNFFGVPISAFGLILGLLFFITQLIPKASFEKTNLTLAGLNGLGCLVLFVYSLMILGSLCPFCTIYYISSIGLFVTLILRVKDFGFDKVYLGTHALLMIILAISLYQLKISKDTKVRMVKDTLYKEFKTYQALPRPDLDSPLFLLKPEEGITIVEIIIFSDFQCPACRFLKDMIHQLIPKFPKYVEIKFYPYPLDSNCHPEMKRQLHPEACLASYFAWCSPSHFKEIHDLLFDNQQLISKQYITDLANDKGVLDCLSSEETKKAIVDRIVMAGKLYNINSTPTLIINGVKVQGVRPIDQMVGLIQAIIDDAKK